MKLYFVRHGQTNANISMANGQLISELDEPLNETGLRQARELAEQLKDVVLDAIISSPLKRAYQTAEAINKYHNLELQVDDMWRERQAGSYIDAYSWHDLFDFDKNVTVENSESLEDFFTRVQNSVNDLKEVYGAKTVLVVSHGGVQHALYAYAHQLPRKGNMRISPMRNCEYRIYEL